MVTDFETVQDLAKFINFLNDNDEEYEKYLSFKTKGVRNQNLLREMRERAWGTAEDLTRPNFIDGFECFVCKRLHENIARSAGRLPPIKHVANASHYGCPGPFQFLDKPSGSLEKTIRKDSWHDVYVTSKYTAQAVELLVQRGASFNEDTLLKVSELLMSKEGTL